MLRIEEIVGAMDDEFRYALDALSDERLAALAADKSGLRRLRPVGVSHAEALEMIAAIQARRTEQRRKAEEAEKRKAARAAKRKATPRRRKQPAPECARTPEPVPAPETVSAPPPCPEPPALPAPAVMAQLPPPGANGPAIRLPPPGDDRPAITLPPPPSATENHTTAPPTPRLPQTQPPRHRLTVGLVLALAVLAALVLVTR